VIVVDTSVILAFMNSADTHHAPVRDWLAGTDDDLVTTPLIVAEADHLVASRGGRRALAALWADLSAGAYVVEWWPSAIGHAVKIAEQYANLGIGLADASLVALAARVETTEIATLDERNFRALRPLGGKSAFRLLPRDV
jgi:predicted nucleic acid-binding protein